MIRNQFSVPGKYKLNWQRQVNMTPLPGMVKEVVN